MPTENEKHLIRLLQREIWEETADARDKWDRDGRGNTLEHLPFPFAFMGLDEEMGKLVRAFNKLQIVEDSETISKWIKERDRRFATTMSMLQRMYLASRHRRR